MGISVLTNCEEIVSTKYTIVFLLLKLTFNDNFLRNNLTNAHT